LLVGVLLLVPRICLADKTIPVEILQSGKDSLGQRFAFEIKEAIRGSRSMRLVTDSSPHLIVHIVTLDPDTDAPGNRTITSVTIVYDSMNTPARGAYLTSYVAVCGVQRINECARGILPDIDSAAEFLRTKWPGLWNTL